MKLKALNADDDAVSPVIGVILMVAITVILAAVIATFVLGLGDQISNSSPQASFSFDYDSDEETVTVEHDGGGTIEAQELYVRGEGIGEAEDPPDDALTEDGSWDSDDIDVYEAESEISAGSRIDVSVGSDYDIDVVWEPQEGGDSATLSESTGPDA